MTEQILLNPKSQTSLFQHTQFYYAPGNNHKLSLERHGKCLLKVNTLDLRVTWFFESITRIVRVLKTPCKKALLCFILHSRYYWVYLSFISGQNILFWALPGFPVFLSVCLCLACCWNFQNLHTSLRAASSALENKDELISHSINLQYKFNTY